MKPKDRNRPAKVDKKEDLRSEAARAGSAQSEIGALAVKLEELEKRVFTLEQNYIAGNRWSPDQKND
jgi:hypothetical protein